MLQHCNTNFFFVLFYRDLEGEYIATRKPSHRLSLADPHMMGLCLSWGSCRSIQLFGASVGSGTPLTTVSAAVVIGIRGQADWGLLERPSFAVVPCCSQARQRSSVRHRLASQRIAVMRRRLCHRGVRFLYLTRQFRDPLDAVQRGGSRRGVVEARGAHRRRVSAGPAGGRSNQPSV